MAMFFIIIVRSETIKVVWKKIIGIFYSKVYKAELNIGPLF